MKSTSIPRFGCHTNSHWNGAAVTLGFCRCAEVLRFGKGFFRQRTYELADEKQCFWLNLIFRAVIDEKLTPSGQSANAMTFDHPVLKKDLMGLMHGAAVFPSILPHVDL